MNSKIHLRVGGVPEHFNLPWQLAAERDIFTTEDIDLAWTVYAGGTGAMTKALNNGELDLAVLLTEGFIAAADQGLKAHIAKVYIESPLVWGIYSGRKSNIKIMLTIIIFLIFYSLFICMTYIHIAICISPFIK